MRCKVDLNIIKEKREFKLLLKYSENFLAGNYLSKLKGEGNEFLDLREYVVGDDVRKIDWNVSARENKVYVKEFLEDKDSTHYILFDTSASLKNKEFFAKVLATSLMLSSIKNRDNVSFWFFNKNSLESLPLTKSKNKALSYIYNLSMKKFEGEGNIENVIVKFLNVVKKKAIVSIITDELELEKESLNLFKALNSKHKVNYFHLFNREEKDLDVGMNVLEDVETCEEEMYDFSYEEVEEYKKEFEKAIEKIERSLRDVGIKPKMLDTKLGFENSYKQLGEVL